MSLSSYSTLAQHLDLFSGRKCSSSSPMCTHLATWPATSAPEQTPPGKLAAMTTAHHSSVRTYSCSHAQYLHQLFSGHARQCSSSNSLMRAATSAPEETKPGKLGPIITNQITKAKRLADLEDVVDQWGDSFDCINTSAAFVKFVRLPYSQQRQPRGSKLLQRLLSMWRSQLQLAEVRQCANVLWACSKLGSKNVDNATWDSTWQAFMQPCQRACADTAGPSLKPQDVSNALLACAKLGKQPTAEELQLLLQLMLHPAAFDTAKVQEVANTVWALGALQQLPGWQGGISEQQVQLLLGEQQVRQLAMEGKPQEISNVVLSLARMATGAQHLISRAFATATAQQLLDAACSASYVTGKLKTSLTPCGRVLSCSCLGQASWLLPLMQHPVGCPRQQLLN